MDLDIDMDLLISLVENRPVLWDKTIESYKIKQLNFAAWKEICIILKDDFETLSEKEKNHFGKQIVKKWNNARDNWMRCAKKLKEYKSGSGTKSVKKYRFYDQMKFLNKIVDHRPTSTNKPPAEVVDGSRSAASAVPKKRKKKDVPKKDELGKIIVSLIDSMEKEQSSIMSFFKGIAPTVEKFNDADMVEFQYEVIKTVRKISQRSLSPYHLSSQSSRNYCQPPTPTSYCSPQARVAQSNQSQYLGFHTLASSSSTNYVKNEQDEGETLINVKRRSSTDSERSRESVDSLDTIESKTVDCFDYDFAKSPEFYELSQ